MTPSNGSRMSPRTAGVGGRNTTIGGEQLYQGTPQRQSLSSLNPHVYNNRINMAYGMSAGVKVGRQQDGPIQRPGVSGSRSGLVGGLHTR